MPVSLYGHAWQALLMFLAGLVSVVASLIGYLRSGGGEELLQQALVSWQPEGGLKFDSLDLDLKNSTLTVHKLRRKDLTEGPDQVRGLVAEQCVVNLDLWPWPPRVDSIHLHGIADLQIAVRAGFLRDSGNKIPRGPPIPVYVHGVNAGIKVGDMPVQTLRNCSGVLRIGAKAELIGDFSLTELNGKPFEFSLSSKGDGRWEFNGNELAIDTQPLHVPAAELGKEPLDPVALLLRALLSGECGAEGTVSELRLLVQPATGARAFVCEGQVAYKNLKLSLPPRDKPAAEAVPHFLDWMLFGKRTLWPPKLMPDEIRTGADGRLAFHMHGQRLGFDCDEGAGSAFIVRKDGQDYPRLESLKGSIETDGEGRPESILLRGIIGQRWSGELRMQRRPAGSRIFDIMLDPRATGERPDLGFDVPLWRFRSRVEDHSEVGSTGAPAGGPLVKFDVEFASQDFPVSPLLPPGVRDVSGRLRIKGNFSRARVLGLEEILWTNGALTYGGLVGASPDPLLTNMYGPVFDALQVLWGGASASWRLQDVHLTAKALARFDSQNRWLGTELEDWKLKAGEVLYKGQSTDLGALGLEVQGYVRPATEDPGVALILIEAGVRESKGRNFKWSLRLSGRIAQGGAGELRFEERDMPLKLHPERGSLEGRFIHGLLNSTVRRTMVIRMQAGKFTREVMP